MINVFIGYDPAEAVAYHVLCHSILARSSVPVRFTPVNKRNIPEFTRGIEGGSTEFSFSRFLVPYLSDYVGQSIFMDCDMIVRCDIAELLYECGLDKDVYVVKHDYISRSDVKFLGNSNPSYPRKNWSSVMVFNNFSSACRRLTPEVVNTASGSYLHRFEWCDDSRIGELGREWNHLVGEYEENENAKIVHFTLGTPCFKGYEDQEFSSEWFKEKEAMNYAN